MIAHPNSIRAHAELKEADQFNPRERLCLQALRQLGQATDRQIMQHLDFTDKNSVSPRLNHLRDNGDIQEVGSVTCEFTGKTVRLLRLTPYSDRNQLSLSL